jgi:hypothetical protein
VLGHLASPQFGVEGIDAFEVRERTHLLFVP